MIWFGLIDAWRTFPSGGSDLALWLDAYAWPILNKIEVPRKNDTHLLGDVTIKKFLCFALDLAHSQHIQRVISRSFIKIIYQSVRTFYLTSHWWQRLLSITKRSWAPEREKSSWKNFWCTLKRGERNNLWQTTGIGVKTVSLLDEFKTLC